ncbi:hypothetical protein BIV60_20995 [Bacillus sp. MUM 116]|uniref:hypothetical protein n=1 Tax=Bacillus sp. MUM 116 TaxID=1678002 RepID=UPI0008F55FF9|nr:hypothetical protein [Bacillus sp. MUM 116]OIK10472.1 hypothetical protein BIV60_20995 [Bacillus sp. MUM 116]
MGALGWVFIGVIAYQIYKKYTVKPTKWKAIVANLIGVFSFTINWNMSGILIKFPILPLGVWILYGILKRRGDSWSTYRPFAWLGFWANFIFLLTSLGSGPIQQVLYPQNNVSTYISITDHAAIIKIYSPGKDDSLNKENLHKQLSSMKQGNIYSEQWYYSMVDSKKKDERFPYQLIGSSPKFGIDLKTIVYVEKDGKGLLIVTPYEQFYFRSQNSLLRGGN